MKEIKFRAWDGLRMTTSGIMFNTTNGSLEIPTSYSLNIDEIPEEKRMVLMQYTGLKDKNGKEIYEGDIVDVGMEDQPDNICIIEKVPNLHGMTTFIIKHPRRGKYGGTGYPEVIGNIYENPELINKEKGI